MEGQRSEDNAGGLKPEPGELDVRLVMNRHALHGRHDDSFDVPTGVAGIVHRRVPAVLRVVLVAVLRTSANVVEVLAIRIDELDRRAVAVDVDNRPYRTPSLDAAEEDAFLLAVHAEVHVSGGRDVVEEHRVPLSESFGEGLSPVARFVGQIGTRVPRQAAPEVDRIVAGEAETNNAAPIIGYLQELHTDLRFRKRKPI